jgi:PPOX class probable F420-dependent enzyme
MDVESARAFVRAHSHAVLATLRRDGTPQLSPVTASVDDAGRFVISSRETAFKVKNLRRNPQAWLCVFPDTFFGEWVTVAGHASIRSLPDAMEPLVEYYRRVSGEHPDWADYRAAMVRDQRCLIEISATAAGPQRAG